MCIRDRNGGQNYYFGGSYKPNLNDYTKPGENGGSMIYGTSPAAAAKPDIKGETSTQTDLGVDMRFFNQRLSFTFDSVSYTHLDNPSPKFGAQSAGYATSETDAEHQTDHRQGE